MINGILKEDGLMDTIHALTINVFTPAQWEEKKGMK
jgi:acid stress-induced BolA-like protein IbaG/YrbA